MNELELSPTPPSFVIQPGTKGRVRKYSLPIAESPPPPARTMPESPLVESPSRLTSHPPLAIAPLLSRHHTQEGSSTASYYTALSSPPNFTQRQSPDKESAMGSNDDDIVGKDEPINQVPSSMPWENTPPDGWGDAWPATQPTSPNRTSQSRAIQPTGRQFSDGFRVPDPPSARNSSFNESQRSRSQSQRSLSSCDVAGNPFGPLAPPHFQRPSVSDSQDRTQSEESYIPVDNDQTQSQEDYLVPPPAPPKRQRQPSIDALPGPAPEGDPVALNVETPKKPKRYIDLSSDSLQELEGSQIPESIRKPKPEYITIHSTQSQTQEWIAPSLPGPTSQDLTKPLNRGTQASSASPDREIPIHNWNSSQITASPAETQMDLSFLTGPPSKNWTSQIDPTKVKEPLALTMETMYPLKTEADRLEDIEKLEERTWKEFHENVERFANPPKSRRK
jgi:hypothetical protein